MILRVSTAHGGRVDSVSVTLAVVVIQSERRTVFEVCTHPCKKETSDRFEQIDRTSVLWEKMMSGSEDGQGGGVHSILQRMFPEPAWLVRF